MGELRGGDVVLRDGYFGYDGVRVVFGEYCCVWVCGGIVGDVCCGGG